MGKISSKDPGNVRLIAVADLHLGRVIPLPEVLKNYFMTPEGAWERLVDFVIDEGNQVDGLLLAGDIFDREENVLEAPYFFEKGLKRLSEAEKVVVAIAGNHDWRSLKRRYRLLSLPRIHVLGLEDTWEHIDVKFRSRTIRIEGWSFPSSEYKRNPLMFIPPPSKDITSIGLLHGECDGNKESPYAPFTSKELAETGRQCWVLGHIHIPRFLRTDPPIFYCGSLQGLESSEQGKRGIWIIDVDEKGRIEVDMIPTASLLWHELVIDITGIDPEEYETLLQRTVEKECTGWPFLKALSMQVNWIGEVHEGMKTREKLIKIEGLYFTLNKQGTLIDCHVHTSNIGVRPAVDLTLLSQEKTIMGLIAKQLVELENDKLQERRVFLQKMKNCIEKTAFSYSHFSLLIDEEELAKQLKAKGYEILIGLLDQREKTKR